MNQYPVWKYTLLAIVILIGGVYALPNLFGEDPSLQISATRTAEVNEATQSTVALTLKNASIAYKVIEEAPQGLLVRFNDTDSQLKAQSLVAAALGHDYIVAMNLSPATPDWLRALNANPMFLGLDLRGGVHFLMEVDMDAAIKLAEERYVSDFKSMLRDEKIRYAFVGRKPADGGLELKFRTQQDFTAGRALIDKEFPRLVLADELTAAGVSTLKVSISEEEQIETKRFALQQNITTLRNRVNELGVAEPVIQQQGLDRIVVQLPGVQDTARAKEILGATATLEFRLVNETGNAQEAVTGSAPIGSRLYYERSGAPILLKKDVIVTGDQIIDAASGLDSQDGSAAVFISLDGQGARKMGDVTLENVGRLMAVVFIESKSESKVVNGETIKSKRTVEEVINVARIRESFSKRFQITGLDSTEEARDLALLLRAGALSVPIEIVEERTVGPSLGQDNIDQGFMAVQAGFILVMIFMVVYYRSFGVIANVALAVNLVLIVALLSMLQATLTMPGIAGIVLTVGMAVDANVLIFERIREEIRAGNSPQASIHAGYAKAISTIADANITTLIAAVVLFGFGSGPVKGFAVTLSIGIITSMFTAILITRALVNWKYGGRRIEKVSI